MKKYFKQYDHVFLCFEGKNCVTTVKTYPFCTEISVWKGGDLKDDNMEEIAEAEFTRAYKKAFKLLINKL